MANVSRAMDTVIPMTHKMLGVIAAFLMLTGCVYHRMGAHEMIDDIDKIHSRSSAYINILWYNGSDEDYDYFGYVYGMLLGKNYKVPVGQFTLDHIPYTEDRTEFVPIRAIEGLWSASRKHDGTWIEDKNGVIIEVES